MHISNYRHMIFGQLFWLSQSFIAAPFFCTIMVWLCQALEDSLARQEELSAYIEKKKKKKKLVCTLHAHININIHLIISLTLLHYNNLFFCLCCSSLGHKLSIYNWGLILLSAFRILPKCPLYICIHITLNIQNTNYQMSQKYHRISTLGQDLHALHVYKKQCTMYAKASPILDVQYRNQYILV